MDGIQSRTWSSQLCLVMDNSSTGLVTAARAGVKTGLVVYLARLEQQNFFSIIGQLLGQVTKSLLVLFTRVVRV